MGVESWVAPFVGAWIETPIYRPWRMPLLVAPFVGAWIETTWSLVCIACSQVAPFVGAWIETNLARNGANLETGRTLRGCVD